MVCWMSPGWGQTCAGSRQLSHTTVSLPGSIIRFLKLGYFIVWLFSQPLNPGRDIYVHEKSKPNLKKKTKQPNHNQDIALYVKAVSHGDALQGGAPMCLIYYWRRFPAPLNLCLQPFLKTKETLFLSTLSLQKQNSLYLGFSPRVYFNKSILLFYFVNLYGRQKKS